MIILFYASVPPSKEKVILLDSKKMDESCNYDSFTRLYERVDDDSVLVLSVW